MSIKTKNKFKIEKNQRTIASFSHATINVEKRTVEVVLTTGQQGKRYDYNSDTEYLEELDVSLLSVNTERLDQGLSVINNHQKYNGIDGVFAITEDYKIADGKITATVRFASDEESDIKFQKVRDRILRHVSLGYIVSEYTPMPRMDGQLQLLRATNWTPTELSFVITPFETTNGVRNNSDTDFYEIQIKEDNLMNLAQLRAALLAAQTRGAPEDEINGLQRQIDTALLAENVPAAVPVHAEPVRAVAEPVAPVAIVATPAPLVDLVAVRTAERNQLQPMLVAVRSAGLKDEFAINNFNQGVSLDKFRGLVIDELGAESSDNLIKPVMRSDDTSDAKQVQRSAVESALEYRSGSKVEMTDQIRMFTGLTLHETARALLVDSGVNVNMMSRQKVAERAFHSTSDFPLILENVMNKSLQAAYDETPQTFADLGRRALVNDFREKHVYNLGSMPNLLPLGEHGEYKAGTFGEGKEKYAIATYARKLGFTRQMLINDDLSALDTIGGFGQAGSRLESNIVWGLILGYDFFNNVALPTLMNDGNPLFDASHGNLLTAGSAFGEAALSDLRKLGRKQKTRGGEFMNISYTDLVIPEDIETAVDKVLTQTILAAVSGDTNPFRGSLQPRVEPRLSQVSQTAYLAFAKGVPSFEYAYLAGEEGMYTEAVTSHDIDGLMLKVRKDFGAGMVDYRGVAKATGAV